jgi:Cu+-exporting ATPase
MCCCEPKTQIDPNAKESTKDVVCGMTVDPATAAGVSEYKGKRYFFCGTGCKQNFDANPVQYA